MKIIHKIYGRLGSLVFATLAIFSGEGARSRAC